MRRILLVEGDSNDADTFKEILEKQGYMVHVADEQFDVVDWCRRERPHLVILDVDTAPTNEFGIDLIRLLDESVDGIPVMALSSAWNDSNSRRAMEAGAHCCAPKPLEHTAAIKVISLLLNSSRRRARSGQESAN